jgi:phenylpropionate dioxygenase-like ring-hydroxylating dioxygenase large terminal subunit
VSSTSATKDVPFSVTKPNRIPKERYYDKEFYELECERFWPRVWQMACRLEEIPNPGDFVVYDILDQSIIVMRVDADTIKAYYNACRHRGVRLLKDRGNRAGGIRCPFHGWSWNCNGDNTFVLSPELFDEENLDCNDLKLAECRVETWGGCAFINMDDDAPPLRVSLEPFASQQDDWHVGTLRTEWWMSCRMPCNWKLAMEAFMEGYHVAQTHPQLVPGLRVSDAVYADVGTELSPFTRFLTMSAVPPEGEFNAREFVESYISFIKLSNVGMAGMLHEKDVRTAEAIVDMELPNDFVEASQAWYRAVNAAVVDWHKERGLDVPDLNDIYDRRLLSSAVNFCFPNYFLLPVLSSAASYRIRPLGPEECLFELWSLTRFPPGQEPPPIRTPTPLPPDDPSWPPIPRQDYSNLGRQQQGLHAKGFRFMRLSREVEGMISNNHRLIEGYLAGLGYDQLLPAARQVSGAIDAEIRDLGFG